MKKAILLILCTTFLWSCIADDPKSVFQQTDDPTDEAPTDDIPDSDDTNDTPRNDGPYEGICENAYIDDYYPCHDYDLVLRIDLDTFRADSGNDCWGWTDPDTGREYAIMGLDNGTAFVDITDPTAIHYVGKVDSETSASPWRDVKVYQNHAFIVSEASGHGMQIFDLTRLRGITDTGVGFNPDAVYTGFGSAHNLVINEETGYAYAVGTTTYMGGPHFVNIQDPLNPIAAGGYSFDSYSHDAQVVTYTGPDSEHLGKEILIGSNENEVVIVDITNKNNTHQLSRISYDQVAYTHQGWFTEDQRFFLFGDELDESSYGFNSRTMILDLTNLDNPEFKFEYYGPTPAIDHNGYVNNGFYYLANYTAGMRVIDLANIENNTLTEVGFFDTSAQINIAAFRGAWSVYPFFASGHIVISDINDGLFIVKKKG